MIVIQTALVGNQGMAQGGGEAVTARTQALALSLLVQRLKKRPELKSKKWIVDGQPELRGEI